MAIENGVRTVIDLDDDLPAKSDYISEGDDHLRLIKHTLRQTFPNANDPLTSEFSELSKTTDYMDFKRDSNDSFNIIEFKDLTQVKNAGNATEDKDLVTLGQVNTLLNTLITERLYPKGSYYMSDYDVDPRIALKLSATSWERVTGFIAGVGSSNNGALNLPGYSFIANGPTDATLKGAHAVGLTEANIPRLAVDGSGYTTAPTSHSHNVSIGTGNADGNDGGSDEGLLHKAGNHPITLRTAEETHSHAIQGTGYTGRDVGNQAAFNIVPPHRVAYIWRRVQ